MNILKHMSSILLVSATVTGCNFETNSSGGLKEEVTLQAINFKSDEYAIFIGDEMSVSEQLVVTYSNGQKKELTPNEAANVSWDFSDATSYLDYDDTQNTVRGIHENDSAFTVSATYDDKVAFAKFNVFDDISSIYLSPSANAVYVGDSITLSVVGTKRSGQTVDLTSNPNLNWVMSDHVSMDKNTMSLQASKTGTASVQVSLAPQKGGKLTSMQNIELKPMNVSSGSSIVITPPAQTRVTAGSSVQLSSQLIDDNGQVVESDQISWSSDNTSLATVTQQGKVSFVNGSSGTVMITASYSNSSRSVELEESVRFTVETKNISTMHTTSSSKNVFPGQSVTLTSLATYGDGTSAELTNTITYHVSPSAQVIGNQVLFGNSTGRYTITPSIGSENYTPIEVRVLAPSLDTISIDVNLEHLMVEQKRSIKALAYMTDGSILDISDVVSWVVSAPDIVIVDGVQIIGAKAGTVNLTAVYNGVESKFVEIQVMDYPVENINFRQFYPKTGEYFIINSISLDDISASSFEFDLTANFKAIGLKDVDPRDVVFSWLPEANTNVSLSINHLDNQRFSLNVQGSGRGTLTASYRGQSLSITVNIAASKLISAFDIAPSRSLHVKDSNVSFSAITSFDDGTNLLINPNQIVWSSSDFRIATISPQGVASYLEAGNVTITGSYTNDGQSFTSSFDVTVLPFYVERLEFSGKYWPEQAYVDEKLDIYQSLYAVLSNGSKINLGFHDVTVSSKLGMVDIFNTWAATVGGVGEEVFTVSYEGVSLDLPPVNIVASTTPVEIRCSIGYMVIDLWGASCWLEQDGRRIKGHSFDFDHPDFAPNVSHVANAYTFDYIGDSDGQVPAGTTLKACGRDSNNCSTRYFDLVPVIEIEDLRDDVTMFVKNGVPTPVPVSYKVTSTKNYTHVDTIEYFPDFNMTLKDDKTLGRFIDNLFYAEKEGSSTVDVYLKWGKKEGQYITSTRNLVVAEPTYEASSDTIDITGAFPDAGVPLPSIVMMTLQNQNGSESRVSDITSELVFDVVTQDFEIVDNKLYFNGSTLPDSVSFEITSASVYYLDVLEHITDVTLDINVTP